MNVMWYESNNLWFALLLYDIHLCHCVITAFPLHMPLAHRFLTAVRWRYTLMLRKNCATMTRSCDRPAEHYGTALPNHAGLT